MAKKRHYAQNFKDRMHEHKGMEGHYEGHAGRRAQELRDAGMIHEDPHSVANLPQHVMYKSYPKNHNYLPEDLDDTIRGIDEQISADNHKRMQHFHPKKV